ncbi:MAG: hypothetical protein KatS3mg105_4129 [Gemmatales bacterium]|nr:MAG: hypothetical protein KatS3mg105_4129 [Gemmatales bacterium]
MRFLANVLVAVSICVGALGAATAYHAPLDLPDSELVGLQLAADAGLIKLDSEQTFLKAKAAEKSQMHSLREPAVRYGFQRLIGLPKEQRDRLVFDRESKVVTLNGHPLPLVPATTDGEPTRLNTEMLLALRDNKVSYVRVRAFEFSRWPGKLLFFKGVAGLLIAALCLRWLGKRELQSRKTSGDGQAPEELLEKIRDSLQQLRSKLDDSPQASLGEIRSRLSELQTMELQSFIEARTVLVARLGMAGFAEVMDRFAAAERQINRAWSAAADGVAEETSACLQRAEQLVGEALQTLQMPTSR